MPISEQGMNELGDPICCEVCAIAGTADDVCESTCKNDLCSRARDVHAMVGQQLNDLSACNLLDCGFSFEACMDTNSLHVQGIITNNDLPQFYGLQAECHAHADEPVRADGLFSYLEDLNGVPGANGPLADEEDVVGYCLGLEGGAATGAPGDTAVAGGTTSPTNDGADSTGGTGGDTDTGETPGPGQAAQPQPCGPFAVNPLPSTSHRPPPGAAAMV